MVEPIRNKFTFTWVIDNFNFISDSDFCDNRLVSPTFYSGEGIDRMKWQLEFGIFDPSGSPLERFISVFIRLLDAENHKVEPITNYSLSVLNVLGNRAMTKSGRLHRKFDMFDDCCWGFKEFSLIQALKQYHFEVLPNNRLTILLEATERHDAMCHDEGMVKNQIQVPESRFLANLYSLYKRGKFTDIVLGDGVTEIKLHKPIVAARCPEVARRFHNPQELINGKYLLCDKDDIPAVQQLAHFIYTGKKSDSFDALRMIKFADFHNLESLKNLCELECMNNLTPDSAVHCLYISYVHDLPQLQEASLAIILARPEVAKNSTVWEMLIQQHPKLANEILAIFNTKLEKKIQQKRKKN